MTPAQREFNRLVAQVEKLAKETRRLEDSLKYYAEHLHPRLRRITALRKDLIRALAPFLDDKQLSKKNRKLIRLLVAEQFEVMASECGPTQDDDLRQVFSRVHGVRYEDAAREELDQVRSEMEPMFADFGIDVDLSELSLDMTPEAIAAKMAKVTAEVRQSRGAAAGQELTAAYRSNDLHTLLRLELQWIEREECNLGLQNLNLGLRT